MLGEALLKGESSVLVCMETCTRLTPHLPCPAVIAISSLDRKTGCYSFWEDFMDVIQILEDWRGKWG